MLEGHKVTTPLEIDLNMGWNLVGVISPDNVYTAGSFIDKGMTQDISLDTVAKFEGKYVLFVKDNGISYGEDYTIFDQRGYFVRVKDKSGTFKP